MPQLRNLFLPDPAESWRNAGFTVIDEVVQLGPVGVLVGDRGALEAWAFDGMGAGELDGLTTRPPVAATANPIHTNGAIGVDHLVITSNDLDRTTAALVRAKMDLRRMRNLPDGITQQRFFWAGATILELVGPEDAGIDAGPLRLGGLALVVPDIERAAASLGHNCSPPKNAVQRGRQICTIRTRQLEISIPIALMSPHARTPDQ